MFGTIDLIPIWNKIYVQNFLAKAQYYTTSGKGITILNIFFMLMFNG